MCGRYTYKLTWKQIVELYRITQPDKEPEGLVESYNVAPTHVMPIVRLMSRYPQQPLEPYPLPASHRKIVKDPQAAKDATDRGKDAPPASTF